MDTGSDRLVVTRGDAPHPFLVHHRDVPDLHADGDSTEEAATNLAGRLAHQLELADDAMHREPLQRALDDVHAFLGQHAPAGTAG